MKKTNKILVWVLLIFIVWFLTFFIYKKYVGKITKICCSWWGQKSCFNIEIADTEESRQLWLMYRKNLPEKSWMLFVFPDSWIYPFRMKNTFIPLAWIRIDENMKIVDIIEMDPCNTENCPSYKPKSEAKYVLEINQYRISEKWLLQEWDTCKLK